MYRCVMTAFLLGLFGLPWTAFAQSSIADDVLVLKAKIQAPTCVFNNDPNGEEFNFGNINPGLISPMPPLADESSLSYTLTKSAFGDFKTIYKQRSYGIELSIRCSSAVLGQDIGRMSMSFGHALQTTSGKYGVASQGYVFGLDNEALKNILGISLFVDDVNAVSGGQNGLVKPGVAFPLIMGESFKAVDDSGDYAAVFRVTPGLFWTDQGAVTGNTSFRLEVPVELIYN